MKPRQEERGPEIRQTDSRRPPDHEAHKTSTTWWRDTDGVQPLVAGCHEGYSDGTARLARRFCMLNRIPRVESSRTGEPHCCSHCHDCTAAPPLPIALPHRHRLFNTPRFAQADAIKNGRTFGEACYNPSTNDDDGFAPQHRAPSSVSGVQTYQCNVSLCSGASDHAMHFVCAAA